MAKKVKKEKPRKGFNIFEEEDHRETNTEEELPKDEAGRRRAGELIRSLGLVAGTVMVIRDDELLTDDDVVEDDDAVEVRAVISGGRR